jgi:cell filamentation protein
LTKILTYIDPDYIYTHPESGVLRNILKITDKNDLNKIETAVVTKRSTELKKNPIVIADLSALYSIHHYLFQDLYTWAGQARTVEIRKPETKFFPLSHFDNAHMFIDNLIMEFFLIKNDDKENLSRKLAEILDAVNFLHPFREGNGRAQREFLRLLAWQKGWTLILNLPDNPDIFKRYMDGTITGNIDVLDKLIFECLS